MCLEDKEPRIVDLAKLFFTDLSTKDNAIYNHLPDGALPSFFYFFTFSFHERAATRLRAPCMFSVFLIKLEADDTRCGTYSHSSKRRNKQRASSKSSASVSD